MTAAVAILPTEPARAIVDAWRAYLESDDYRVACESQAALVELMAEIRDLPDEDRHEALVWWARSPLWGAPLMLCLDWQGRIARDAYRALKRELAADTPGRRWNMLEPSVGRASIHRLLALTGDPAAIYAAAPFRSWTDDDGRAWIAGAIGCPPYFDNDAALRWEHLDITDVILWDPRTNEARIAGEHASTSVFVMPEQPDPRLTIWGDCGAFFRAWAARRVRTGKLWIMRARGEWQHPIDEPADGNLPGGLLIGDAFRARWPVTDSTTIVAGAGLSATELHAAAFRAARLPVFEGA